MNSSLFTLSIVYTGLESEESGAIAIPAMDSRVKGTKITTLQVQVLEEYSYAISAYGKE